MNIKPLFLSIILFLPVMGAFLVWLLPRERERTIRALSLVCMAAGLALGVILFLRFDPTATISAPDFEYSRIWFLNVNYHLGIDGISLLLIELTLLLGPVVILSSWTTVREKVKEYHCLLLLLQTGMLGTFMALDLILFYVFWELVLIPMYLIIGLWGGPRRVYATLKFFLFTMTGSVLMLVAILYISFLPNGGNFDLVGITLKLSQTPLRRDIQMWLFLAFALAFAIKVPMFPFHTWLPDAHVEAPTAGSVILAGVLLKMGTYGFVRIALPLFPAAAFALVPLISVLALIGIIYGALVAMVQTDVKKLVAYSSVSHLGFVMLGLFALTPAGVQGAVLQMVNHGLSTGALFLLVGIIYERRHTRMIADFGGLARSVPLFALFFMVVTLSSIGLPGLNGFVGEFLILSGTFVSKNPGSMFYAVIAATGVIFAAVYMLWLFQRMMFGPLTREENRSLADLSAREVVYLLVITVFMVWIGICPNTFLSRSQKSVDRLIELVEQGRNLTGDELPPPLPLRSGKQ